MRIVAIDPGTTESAYVVWDGKTIINKGLIENCQLLGMFEPEFEISGDLLLIEEIQSYGMAVGREVFQTVFWAGRFAQVWQDFHGKPFDLVPRREIKLHHCGIVRAKDGNVIAALKEKYGDKGTKNNPGLTYGLKADIWQAFALATYYTETHRNAA